LGRGKDPAETKTRIPGKKGRNTEEEGKKEGVGQRLLFLLGQDTKWEKRKTNIAPCLQDPQERLKSSSLWRTSPRLGKSALLREMMKGGRGPRRRGTRRAGRRDMEKGRWENTPARKKPAGKAAHRSSPLRIPYRVN